MIWVVVPLLVASLIASSVVRGRMFVHRHDQKWRRAAGATFGAAPLGLWWHDIYRSADYSPQGQRLLPLAIALEAIALVLAVTTLVVLFRAA